MGNGKQINDLPLELLQMTLANLDFRDLYRCQLVSQDWNTAIIHGSPGIKEALWLSSKTEPRDTEDHQPLQFTVAVREFHHMDRFQQLNRGTRRLEFKIETAEASEKPIHAKLHPLLGDLKGLYLNLVNPHITGALVNHWPPGFEFTSLDDLVDKTETNGHEMKGSWMDMSICLPPVKSIRVELKWDYSYSRGPSRLNKHRDIEQKEGVRLKHLTKAFQGLISAAASRAALL